MELKRRTVTMLLACLILVGALTATGCKDQQSAAPKTTTSATGTAPSKDGPYFTPYDDVKSKYLAFVRSARVSLHVADYTFTDEDVADAYIEVANNKVPVHVILDKSESHLAQRLIDKMRAAGIEVVIGTSELGGIMHCKYTVVDGVHYQRGSWNYTDAANKQDNDFCIYYNDPDTQKFMDNWQRMYRYMTTGERTLSAPHKHRTKK